MASTITTLDPNLLAALETAVETLRRVAEYELEPRLEQRMHELGGNKEQCSEKDREEYMAWAEFCTQRTIDKLKALNTLQHLRDSLPELEALADLDQLLDISDQS